MTTLNLNDLNLSQALDRKSMTSQPSESGKGQAHIKIAIDEDVDDRQF